MNHFDILVLAEATTDSPPSPNKNLPDSNIVYENAGDADELGYGVRAHINKPIVTNRLKTILADLIPYLSMMTPEKKTNTTFGKLCIVNNVPKFESLNLYIVSNSFDKALGP